MKKQPLVFVTHMIESIEIIESYVENKSKDDFLDSSYMQDAVLRRLEIIGEAAKNLFIEVVKNYPEVPWPEIIRMRDRLAHHYFGVNLELVWEMVHNDLPPLKKQLIQIKNDLEKIG